MYKIEVTSIRLFPDAEYIGRGSPLGNPFVIGPGASRNEVCDQYEEWFKEQLHQNNTEILAELKRLHIVGRQKKRLKLGCFCRPMHRCHGDSIKQWMEENYDLLDVLTEECFV